MGRSIPFSSEAEWLTLRESNIGGSEIASLFYAWTLPDGSEVIRHMFEPVIAGAVCMGCLSTYKSGYRLWHEKAGKLKPEDFGTDERVQAGKHLEPALASWSEDKWGWTLRKTRRYLVHDIITGWGSSFDYELVQAGSNYPPIEFKNVDFLIFRDKWEASEEDADLIAAPPIHINLQLQAQIGCSGADHGYIVVCVSGNDLRRARIDRHDATQLRIGEAIASFWAAVREGIAPDAYADTDTVADIYNNGRDYKAPLDLRGDNELPLILRRMDRWKKHADFVGAYLDRHKARVMLRMGEANRAVAADGWSITWPAIHRKAETKTVEVTEKDYRGGLTYRQKKTAA